MWVFFGFILGFVFPIWWLVIPTEKLMYKTRLSLEASTLIFWLMALGSSRVALCLDFTCDIELFYSISSLNLNLLIVAHNDDYEKKTSLKPSIYKILAYMSQVHFKNHFNECFSVPGCYLSSQIP